MNTLLRSSDPHTHSATTARTKHGASVCHGALWLALAVACSGCVSSEYRITRDFHACAAPLNLNVRDGGVYGTLLARIVPGKEGSWKHKAYWEEYALSIVNVGQEPVSISAASLRVGGGRRVAAGDDPWALEAWSRKPVSPSGPDFAGHPVVATTTSVIGYMLSMVGSLTGDYGKIATGMVMAIAVAAVPAVMESTDENARRRIELEFDERRIKLPVTLQAGDYVDGSLFFPITRGGEHLEIEFSASDHAGRLRFDLGTSKEDLSDLPSSPTGSAVGKRQHLQGAVAPSPL